MDFESETISGLFVQGNRGVAKKLAYPDLILKKSTSRSRRMGRGNTGPGPYNALTELCSAYLGRT